MSARAAPAPPRVHPPDDLVDDFAARGDWRRALWIALAVLAATAAANLPFLASYAVRGDDGGFLLHSARFFRPSAGDWFTRGFGDYFINFPEATRDYTRFLRPTVNLSAWLESWLAPSPNSPVFLLTNYLGHALCAALVYLLARRMARLPVRAAVLAAALFAGSAASLELFQSAAFRGDMLGAFWGMTGLLIADAAPRSGRRTACLAAAWTALLLAVFAKETAITAPFIAAAWVGWTAWRSGEGGRARSILTAVLLASPAFVYVAAKAMLQGGGGGAYVSIARFPRNAAQTLASAFFPGGGAFELRALPRVDSLPPLDGARMTLAVALSISAFLLLARRMVRGPRDGRIPALALATGAALAVPMLLAPFTRLMYFGQMFALPLLVLLAWEARGRAKRVMLALALLANPAWLLVKLWTAQPEAAALNRESARLQRVLAAELRDPAVKRVYLLNDVVGAYGSRALLQVATTRAGREDVAVRVTNAMGRPFAFAGARGEPVRVEAAGDALRITSRCGAGCDFSFPGVLPEDRARLGVPGVIRYERVADREMVVDIPRLARGDWLVVGYDPASPGPHLLRPNGVWRAAPE